MSGAVDVQAQGYLAEGEAAYQNGDYSKAQTAFAKAARCFSQANDPWGEAAALTNLGAAYADTKQYFKAIETLEAAIRLHQANNNREGLALTTFSLATTLFDSAQPFRSWPVLEKAERLLRSIGNDTLADQVKSASEWLSSVMPVGLSDDDQTTFDGWSNQLKTASESAMTSYHVGDFAHAVNHWRAALQASEALNRNHQSAEFLVYIGAALCRGGHFDEGVEVLEGAASFAHDVGSGPFEAAAFNSLGCAHMDLGNLASAIECLQRAIEIGTEFSPPANVAESLGNLGMAFARNGDADSAVSTLSRALELYRSADNREAIAFIEERIPHIAEGAKYEGSFVFADPAAQVGINDVDDLTERLRRASEHESAGDYQDGQAIYRQLLVTATEVGDRRFEAFVLIRIGFAARRLGDLSQSLMSYHQALSAARAANDSELEATALNNLGVLYVGADRQTAINYLAAAARIREGLTDKQELGETYLTLAQLSPEGTSTDYFRKAISLLDPDRGVYVWASAYRELKKLLFGAELQIFLDAHLETARRCGVEDLGKSEIDTVESLHDFVPLDDEGMIGLIFPAPKGRQRTPDFEWQLKVVRAQILWDTDHHSAAIRDVFAAVDEIEKLRATISFEYQRREYLDEQWSVYDTLVTYLLAENRVEEALEVIERVKARSILDVVGDANYLPRTIPVDIREYYTHVRNRLRQGIEEIAEVQKNAWAGESETLSAARHELARLFATLNRTTEKVRTYQPDFSPDLPVSVPSYQRMRSFLRTAQHAFVIFWIGEKTCGAFILSQDGIKFIDLPSLEGPLAEFQKTLDRLPVTRADLTESLVALYGSFFEPLILWLDDRNINELTFIPHHHAHLVPFHALSEGNNYLIDKYRVDYAPSFALYQLSLERAKNANCNDALIVANPDGSLKNAELEAQWVRKLLSEARVLRGDEANLEALLPLIRESGIIHFACHGQFGPDQGRDIALSLAPKLNHNGLLTLRQVVTKVSVGLGALVVLSACKTGRTLLSRSDDYVGLPGGFVLAGAAAIVGSLWPVDDVSTCLLMQRFYDGLFSGLTHARALQNAQLWLRDLSGEELKELPSELWQTTTESLLEQRIDFGNITDKPFAHPYYWAGFFAVGTWNLQKSAR